MKIVRQLMAAVLAVSVVLMTGCFQENKINLIDNLHNMTIAISEDAPQSIREAADEFINRAAYYSEGSLQIQMKETSDIQQTLEKSEANFVFAEVSDISQAVECLKTLELPFFFKDEVYHYSGFQASYRTQVCQLHFPLIHYRNLLHPCSPVLF